MPRVRFIDGTGITARMLLVSIRVELSSALHIRSAPRGNIYHIDNTMDPSIVRTWDEGLKRS